MTFENVKSETQHCFQPDYWCVELCSFSIFEQEIGYQHPCEDKVTENTQIISALFSCTLLYYLTETYTLIT